MDEIHHCYPPRKYLPPEKVALVTEAQLQVKTETSEACRSYPITANFFIAVEPDPGIPRSISVKMIDPVYE
jgi:hypothetical protein